MFCYYNFNEDFHCKWYVSQEFILFWVAFCYGDKSLKTWNNNYKIVPQWQFRNWWWQQEKCCHVESWCICYIFIVSVFSQSLMKIIEYICSPFLQNLEFDKRLIDEHIRTTKKRIKSLRKFDDGQSNINGWQADVFWLVIGGYKLLQCR